MTLIGNFANLFFSVRRGAGWVCTGKKRVRVMSMRKSVTVGIVALMSATTVAAPKVKIDKIENTSVWSTKKVTYTVSDVPAADGVHAYTLAFDVTACGVTIKIEKGHAQNGTFTDALDTETIFAETRTDPNAKIRVSIEKIDLEPVQLWEEGPYFARCNIGAMNPEDSGYRFWSGDTVGYKRNGSDWDAVDGSKKNFGFVACPTSGMDNDTLKTLGYIDDVANPVLNATHDAATVHLGAPWRMMTDAELQKLVDTEVCIWTWVTSYNGKDVKGYVVKGAKDPYKNNEVFFPATSGSSGDYWTSSPSPASSALAWDLSFDAGSFRRLDISRYRYYGFRVRPVR